MLANHFPILEVKSNDEKVWGLGDSLSNKVKALMLYDLAQVREASIK